MEDPFEIQKCDECGRFESNEEAAKQHDLDCLGCYWPKVDYQAAALSWIESLTLAAKNKKLLKSIDEIGDLLSERGEAFLKALPDIILFIEEILASSEIMSESHKTPDLFEGLLNFLRKTSQMRADGDIPSHAFWTYEELYDEGLVPNPEGKFKDHFAESVERANRMSKLRTVLHSVPQHVIDGLYLEARRRSEPKQITVDFAISAMAHTFSKEEVEAITQFYESKK